MTPERWARLKEVFSEAAELPAEERSRYVHQACALSDGSTDFELASEIEQMLKLSSQSRLSIDTPAVADAVAGFVRQAESWRSLEPDEMLGDRFRILRRAGAGGMGEVYEAEDTGLGSRVAIKTILPALLGDARVLARFRREVQLARQITHPNVCRIFDLMELPRSTGGNANFLTMEFLDGEPLSQRLRRDGVMSFAEATPILEQVIAGLTAAHESGVVHRDVKSSNIFLSKDAAGRLRVVVTDFGLARAVRDDTGISHSTRGSSVAIGTPAYLAPEQVESKPVGPAADQYSLGVVMYEMATGEQPFDGDSPLLVAVKRLKERPKPPHEVRPGVPARWESAIMRCLEYDPRDRFPDVAALAEALRGGRSIPYIRRTKAKRWGLGSAAAAAAIAGALYMGGRLQRPDPLPPEVARLYQDGTSAILNGSWYRAQQALAAAVQAKPDLAEARARYAESLMELDQFDQARTEVLRATDMPKRSKAEELLVKGTRGLILRDFPAACSSFDARLKLVEADEESSALLDLARCQDKAYQTEPAKASFERVLAQDPTNPAALTALAAILDRQGKSEDALKLLDKARESYKRISFQEGAAEVDLKRAAVLDQISRLKEARGAANRAFETARTFKNVQLSLQAKLKLASLAVKMNDGPAGKVLAAEALEEARTAKLENALASGFIDLSAAFYSQRQYEDAAMYAEQGLKHAETIGARRLTALGQQQLARTYAMLNGRTKDAYTLLDQSDTFFRESGFKRELVRNKSARAASLFVDDEVAAEKLYKEIIPEAAELQEYTIEIPAWANLGRLALLRGEYKAAEGQYQHAVDLSRASGQTTRELNYMVRVASVKTRLGKFQDAEALLTQVLGSSNLRDDGVRLQGLQALVNLFSVLLKSAEADRFQKEALTIATRRKNVADVLALRASACLISAEAGWVKETPARCGPLAESVASTKNRAIYSEVLTALAIHALDQKHYTESIRLAKDARRVAMEAKQERNVWYARLIQADGERKSGNEEAYKQSAAAARHELDVLGKSWGAEQQSLYLKRPDIARRWGRIQ